MKWNVWSVQETSYEWIEWCEGREIEADTVEEARIKAAKGYRIYNNKTRSYHDMKIFKDNHYSCLTPKGVRPAWGPGFSSNGKYIIVGYDDLVDLEEAIRRSQ